MLISNANLIGNFMKKPWYQDGLLFKCTECGACCTGSPGYVWVSPSEIDALAQRLGISSEIFIKKYTRRIGNRLSLKEHATTFDCVFLKGKQCQVYEDRPQQCRTFPWWPENLTSRDAWLEAAERCEGIEHAEGHRFSAKEIQFALNENINDSEEDS